MFRTVPLSIIRSLSLYTQQWYMSYSLRAGSGRNILILRMLLYMSCCTCYTQVARTMTRPRYQGSIADSIKHPLYGTTRYGIWRQPDSFPQFACSKATGGHGVVTNVWSYADTPLYVFVTGGALPI